MPGDTLLDAPVITAGRREGGGIFVYSSKPGEQMAERFGQRAEAIDVNTPATICFGQPIPIAALLSMLPTLTSTLRAAWPSRTARPPH
ncbi:hypothetical protein Q4543_18325 [Salipiger sp. 1_MG-2023]|uniref:hypothetical protein n=1 Tax=Salipiger sp. 1_MG-2023 TaxID=3062665 RepID=UPI0026E2D89E|nr:hypothetical protein [Salipiger sp. 1_MG-2023]MDO6587473.1 hypothetical protein [Salipiger sp. 1_MG-2023]